MNVQYHQDSILTQRNLYLIRTKGAKLGNRSRLNDTWNYANIFVMEKKGIFGLDYVDDVMLCSSCSYINYTRLHLAYKQ